MNIVDLFLAEFDREVKRSRRALESVPEGKSSWKPHEKSMEFGYLAYLVAAIPTWLTKIIKDNELDVAPKDSARRDPPHFNTSAEYVAELERAAAEVRAALQGTNEDHLQTPWKLLAAGHVVIESPRHEMIRETINHWAHHRGQMTVYLRLLGAKVPALYGPSADDKRFA
jgi:uncharacterized damage-inducible protein DinB